MKFHQQTISAATSRRRAVWFHSAVGFVLVVLALCSAHAEAPGAEAVVIYNRRLPESKSLAEYYALRRHVPSNQVIGLKLPVVETMTRAEYRVQLQAPLLEELEQKGIFKFETMPPDGENQTPGRKLAFSSIRYAVLCYGVPLRIAPDSSVAEPGIDQLPAPLQRNEAAVDSELAILPVHHNLRLTGPVNNPFYGVTNAAVLHPTNGILLVARLDGPSVRVARALVDKAMAAEETGLWGRAYFDLRGLTEGEYLTGDQTLKAASDISRRLGFETVVDEQPATFPAAFPLSQVGFYAGWYDEHISGPFARPTVEFMPGAFAYHLHSFSAVTIRSPHRQWVGPLLAKGVTATMGSVYEPYLGGAPDMAVFLGRWVGLGFTFGEAACAASKALSWQTTVVGDPLYRPFGRKPSDLHAQLRESGNALIEWSSLRVVNLNLATGLSAAELIGYLQQEPDLGRSAVLQEKLGDLYAVTGEAAPAIAAYEKALQLKPTPQQTVRLILTLAPLFETAGEAARAYALYEQLLKPPSQYPDQPSIVVRMRPLAEKLGKLSDLEKLERQGNR